MATWLCLFKVPCAFVNSLAILSTMMATGSLSGDPSSELLEKEIRQEGPKKWEECKRESEKLQGDWSFRVTFANDDPPQKGEREHRTEFKYNQNCKLLVTMSRLLSPKGLSPEETDLEEAFGANSRYAFRLRRKAPDQPWVVLLLVDLRKEALPEMISERWKLNDIERTGLVRLDSMPLADVIRDPAFRIVKCQSIERDGEHLVEVQFKYPHPVSKLLPPVVFAQEGSFTLDPKRYWCVRAWDLRAEFAGAGSQIHKLEVSLDADSPTLPIPKQFWGFNEVTRNDKKKRTVDGITENHLRVRSQLPGDEEFTLTAFGLPEPFGLVAPRPPTPWYLWGLVAAGSVILVGLIFGWARRRRQTHGPA